MKSPKIIFTKIKYNVCLSLSDEGVSQCRPLPGSSGSPVEVFYQNKTTRNRYGHTVPAGVTSVYHPWLLEVLVHSSFSDQSLPTCLCPLSGLTIQRLFTPTSPSHCLPPTLLLLPLALRTPPPLAPLIQEQQGRAWSGLTQPVAVTALMASWTASPRWRRRGGSSRGVRGLTACWGPEERTPPGCLGAPRRMDEPGSIMDLQRGE